MLSICIQIKGHCYDGSRFVLSVWCWQACSFWMLPSTNPRYLEPPGAARYESWCTFVQISRCRRLWPARLSSIINLDASFDHGKGAVALRVRFMQSCATTRMLLFCESMQFQLPETVLELHGAHSCEPTNISWSYAGVSQKLLCWVQLALVLTAIKKVLLDHLPCSKSWACMNCALEILFHVCACAQHAVLTTTPACLNPAPWSKFFAKKAPRSKRREVLTVCLYIYIHGCWDRKSVV